MCLILIAHQLSARRPLLVLANRDEFYGRPTAAAAEWHESPGLFAGRDLVSGGTWFGARNDRWAAVTNFRAGSRDKESHNSRSRGWLVRDYLQGSLSPSAFLSSINTTAQDFAGFNLLLGDTDELWYTSNREVSPQALSPGVYGLSNHLLDTPWPKLVRGTEGLKQLLTGAPLNREAAFRLLAESDRAMDDELPDTGIPLEWERALSAIFITLPEYGTRSSTLLQRESGHCQLIERRFADTRQSCQESLFSWTANGSLLDR